VQGVLALDRNNDVLPGKLPLPLQVTECTGVGLSLFLAWEQCGFPSSGQKPESPSLGRKLGQGVHLLLLPLNQIY
jgi:hypothetical protein